MTEPNPEEPNLTYPTAARMWLNLAETQAEKQDAIEHVSLLTEDAFLLALMAYATVDPELKPGDVQRFQKALLKLAELIEPGTPGEAGLHALIAATYYPEENWEMMNMHARLGHMINGEPPERSEMVEIMAMSAHLRSPWLPEWPHIFEYTMEAWKRKEREARQNPELFED